MEWPKLMRDRIGMKVRITKNLRNGYCQVPIGTLATITHWHGGAHIRTDPCPRCGVKLFFSKVPEKSMEPCEEVQSE